MKIAISVWENRVSPLFDAAGHILLVRESDREIIEQENISVESLTLFQRVALLKKLKIDLFVCGGITLPILENIRSLPVLTIPYICGNVDCILDALLKGKDIKSLFSMPGHFNEESD